MTMMENSEEISGHFRDNHASCDFQSLWLEQYTPRSKTIPKTEYSFDTGLDLIMAFHYEKVSFSSSKIISRLVYTFPVQSRRSGASLGICIVFLLVLWFLRGALCAFSNMPLGPLPPGQLQAPCRAIILILNKPPYKTENPVYSCRVS